MFRLSENYEVDRRILKCDFIRYSPAEISTTNTANSQVYFNKPREDSVISLLNSYLELILMYYKPRVITDMWILVILD